ncbi:MAG: HAD-IIA family hydrolase [Alkalispirochaeta sp.]
METLERTANERWGELKDRLADVRGVISDMDGVIYHGNRLLPGAKAFIEWVRSENKRFLFLTNSSRLSRKELQAKLSRLGIDVGADNFYTSALATAGYLASQKPHGSAYVLGDTGLTNALYDVGYTMNEVDPDYVVVGETRSYSYEQIEKAIQLVFNGAKLVGTNPDISGPGENGIVPACGALTKPIELVTGVTAYYVGKPNPLMMRQAMKRIECHREETLIVGDRMDTDIIAGIESEINTVLVLTGVTGEDELRRFGYQPDYILEHIGRFAEL